MRQSHCSLIMVALSVGHPRPAQGGCTMIDLSKITDQDIETASKVDDLDAALVPMMDKAGITSGDVAGMVLDHEEWSKTDAPFRVDMLRKWIRTESLYLHQSPE